MPACWDHMFKYKAETDASGDSRWPIPSLLPPLHRPRTRKVSMVRRDGQMQALHPLRPCRIRVGAVSETLKASRPHPRDCGNQSGHGGSMRELGGLEDL